MQYPQQASLSRFQPPAEPLTSTAAEFNHEVQRQLLVITADDVLDEAVDAEASLQAALLTGDATVVGEVLLAVRQAYAERLASRELYDGAVLVPTTDEVARKALALAHTKAQARRFTGEAPSAFGALL